MICTMMKTFMGGSPAKGWHADAPLSTSEREQVLDKCGKKCFLGEVSRNAKTGKLTAKFPVCKKCKNNHCDCKIDDRGLAAAKMRAREWKYPSVLTKVANLQNAKKGDSTMMMTMRPRMTTRSQTLGKK